MHFNKKEDPALNKGMPPLDLGSKPYSYFEFWPSWFFYAPVVVYWILLSIRFRSFGLPLVVNPHIFLGGMVGESKTAICKLAGPHAQNFILPFLSFVYDGKSSAEVYLQRCAQEGLELPLVAKPDMGCRGSGVRLIEQVEDLQRYLDVFPQKRGFLMQQLAPYAAEAGVFYVRHPDEVCGKLVSITLKYRPVVMGDGIKSVRELITADPRANKLKKVYLRRHEDALDFIPEAGQELGLVFAGSHARGSIFRNGNAYITPELSLAIDKLMQDFPEFHYGRLDIKFASMEKLMRGEDFVVIEVNGVSSEATHIWDSRTRLYDVFTTLFWQYRTLFSIGAAMRLRGYKVPSLFTMVKTWIRELRYGKAYPRAD